MFERTKSIWQRMWGNDSAPYGMEIMSDERREAARHDAEHVANYRPADCKERNWLIGKIRNVSRGGINLLVRHRPRVGELLIVELPFLAEHDRKTVLTCVVHVDSAGQDEWALGCTFSRDLTNDDLAALIRQNDGLEMDKRSRPRYVCRIEATYHNAVDEDPNPQPAQVLNLSTTGIGLLTKTEIPPGTLITVELTSADHAVSTSVLCCVVHTSRDDGQWALGCNFIGEMDEEDVQELLAE